MGRLEMTGEQVLAKIRRLFGAVPEERFVRPRRRHLGVAIALLVYSVAVLVTTMWPVPVDRGHESTIRWFLAMLHSGGAPDWFGYSQLEFAANVAMFLPLGVLVGMMLPRGMGWLGLLLLPAFSAGIELTQAVLLSQRFATVDDVAANSIGGWVGVLIALGLRARRRARDRDRFGPGSGAPGTNAER